MYCNKKLIYNVGFNTHTHTHIHTCLDVKSVVHTFNVFFPYLVRVDVDIRLLHGIRE